MSSARPSAIRPGESRHVKVWYELDEAVALLAGLEDASDRLIAANQLGLVVAVEHQIRILSQKLGFDDWPRRDNH